MSVVQDRVTSKDTPASALRRCARRSPMPTGRRLMNHGSQLRFGSHGYSTCTLEIEHLYWAGVAHRQHRTVCSANKVFRQRFPEQLLRDEYIRWFP